MFKKSQIIKGTLILTVTGLISRSLGFLYRIFLSNLIGAKGMGIFQLIFPVLTFCTALSCGGIQTAVSRFVAESKSKSHCFMVFVSSIILSLTLSSLTCACLYYFALPVSVHIIKNAECADLLKYASFTIPLSAFHSCVAGYYLGLKKTFVPAWSAVFEQIIKLVSLYVLSVVWLADGISLTPAIAVISMIISELSGTVFCMAAVFSEEKFPFKLFALLSTMKKILSMSYMLTLNKIMLTFLQCGEAILVPVVLMKSGLSSTDALSIYGILTGMALPIISFPSTINSSVCTMILPTIAKANAGLNTRGVRYTAGMSVWFSMIMGIFCLGIFIFYGDFLGTEVFGHPQAGEYIKILAWLCPFMYLSMTLGSILHGLGKTNLTFIHNLAGTLIRLGFLWFAVPQIGITGYFWGLLAGDLVTDALHGFYVKKYVDFEFNATHNIIKPTLWLFSGIAISSLLRFILKHTPANGKLFDFASAGICVTVLCMTYAYFVLREYRALTADR